MYSNIFVHIMKSVQFSVVFDPIGFHYIFISAYISWYRYFRHFMQLGSPPWFVIGCYSRCRTSHRGRLSPWQCGACLVSLSVPQPASGSLPCILKHVWFSVGAVIAPLVLVRALFHTFFSFFSSSLFSLMPYFPLACRMSSVAWGSPTQWTLASFVW